MFNMKFLFAIPLLIGFVSYSGIEWNYLNQEEEKNKVVLELFTSEGCSSCPPADELLSQYSEQTKAGKNNIIALSFHVHYWDRLGRSDPYSDQKYSDRQRAYGKKLNIRKVFTPQMIVNGNYSFVGSDKEEADKAIAKAKSEPMSTTVSISEIMIEDNYCQFKYRLSESSKKTTLNFALTENGLSQKVLRGENKNKLLKHDNVVRAFKTVESPKKSAEVFLRLPNDGDLSKMRIVVYVQQTEDLKIIGAASKKVK